MNEYECKVETNLDLGTASFMRGLLRDWMGAQECQPEFFGHGEPVNRSIAQEGLEGAVAAWVEGQRPMMLRRKSAPRLVADVRWRPEKGRDPRPYPWGCTAWLALSARDALAISLFELLIRQFKPAFGMLSTSDDYKRKHFAAVRDRVGTIQKFVGHDTTDKIPGIYWCTYFGPELAERLGIALSVRGDTKEMEGGILVRAYRDSSEIGTPNGMKDEQSLRERIGRGKFFDLADFAPSSLKIDSATTVQIEAAIARQTKDRS